MPEFFSEFGSLGAKYECWVSHLDPDIAITELDLRRLKREVRLLTARNYSSTCKICSGDVLLGAPGHLHPVHVVRVLPPRSLLHLQPVQMLPHPG